MKPVNRLKATVIAAVATAVLVAAPITKAQDKKYEDPGPGKGGPIVQGNFGSDIATLNPIIVQDGASADVVNQLFPAFVGGDPDTGLPTPGARGSIAKEWTASPDGLTYTFKLRNDWKWSDGTPITSADVKYSWDAISSGKVDNGYISDLANIASVEAPDPQTIVVKFKQLDCAAVIVASEIPVVPSETYKKAYPTFDKMTADNPYNLKPTVSGGAFKFSNFRPGEQVTLEADQGYPDAVLGHVVPQGWIYKNIADQNTEIEQFLAGNITYVPSIPEAREDELKKLGTEGKVVYNELPAGSRQIFIFNTGDPAKPTNGVDANGKPVDQGHHPIFGDLRVRKAFAMSVDFDALNKGAFNGHGIPVAGPLLSSSWAFNADLKPWAYDPAQAAKLLDEAGFVDDDNNPDTPRVANDKAMYAKPGTKLEFALTTFPGNGSVDAANVLIQDQVKKTGFKLNLDNLEFQTAVKKVLSQQFDTATFFLGIGRQNPGTDLLSQFGTNGDLVNSGLNAGSWYNAEFNDLVNKSQSLPGCKLEDRKKLLDRAQQIVHDELPWYFVNTSMVPFVVHPDLKNYDPKRYGVAWNIDAWFSPVMK